jgi:hypothetical protein
MNFSFVAAAICEKDEIWGVQTINSSVVYGTEPLYEYYPSK